MSAAPSEEVPALVEHLFRHESARMLANLTRFFGLENLDLAEEVVQEAMIQALRQWPFHGIPDSPRAWLTQAARNKALDILRRRATFRRKQPELEREFLTRQEQSGAQEPSSEQVEDDQLAMIFACCHPAIPAETRIALTLKSVGGFSVPEIARAFLMQGATVAQRLVRAKRRIQDEGLTLTLPAPAEVPARLDSVLQVIYLTFNEGYTAHQGEDLVRQDLCQEAIRLAFLLVSRPDTALPKVHALLALLLLQASRLEARVDSAGDLLLLDEQDPTRWDEGLVQLGMRHLDAAANGAELSTYHLQAAIAAHHAVVRSPEQTDWAALLALYDDLLERDPSPVVALNRAVAVAKVHGPGAGLESLDAIGRQSEMRQYYLLPAVRAHFLLQTGRSVEAAECYRAALQAPCSEPERRFLQKRLSQCQAHG